MASDHPFTIEYAKSARAGCKGCKGGIGKDSLRVGIMVQSPHFDGKVPLWHHYACFLQKMKKKPIVGTEEDFHGFANIRWDDQEKVRAFLRGERDESGGPSGAGEGDEAESQLSVEYAKSSRSSCKICETKIMKGEVRISKKPLAGGYEQWHHMACFAEKFGVSVTLEDLEGFDSLKDEDKKLLKGKLTAQKPKKRKEEINGEGPVTKKKKGNETVTKANGNKDSLTDSLKKQSEALWKIRDKLREAVNKKDMVVLLEENDQLIPKGESKILDHLSDVMLFGPLEKCPECKEGDLIFSTTSNAYRCCGDVSGFTKCQYMTQDPKRKVLVIPEELKENEYLGSFKSKKGTARVFSKAPATSRKSGEPEPPKILSGLQFVVSGQHLTKKEDFLRETLRKHGAEVVGTVSAKVLALISSKQDVEAQTGDVKKSSGKKCNVAVLDEAFVLELESLEPNAIRSESELETWLAQHIISEWGVVAFGTKLRRLKQSLSGNDELRFTKSVPKSQKVVVKQGGTVEAECPVADKTHVYKDRNGNMYSQTLNVVDVQHDINSYYKLQLLQHDEKKNKFYIFRAWGRVGTSVGGSKLENFSDIKAACAEFNRIYFEKTGNMFENRHNFEKKPHKFFPVEVSYDEDFPKSKVVPGSKSKLPLPVQDIIQLIFDVEAMKETMKELEIDLQKMPLGKLSKNQIKRAYTVLGNLQQLMSDKASDTQILDSSNQFYTIIPHDFGMKKPPLLDSEAAIKEKVMLLDSLMDIQLAYSILKSEEDVDADPLDEHYRKLKTELVPMDKTSDEYKRLIEYVENTHAPTHTMYKLEVEEIFRVDREGEAERYKKFADLHNRMLLWHGSRLSNYAGILSQGLRIAPPEAPVTGYMFGKGIYFADMVTKSANYCYSNKHTGHTTGLLMLCEVAMGNMLELTGAKMITSLPKGKESTKGMGATEPDPKANLVLEDGVIVPMGKAVETNVKNSSLLYNEYIVYDVDQVKIKYLFKTNFNYK